MNFKKLCITTLTLVVLSAGILLINKMEYQDEQMYIDYHCKMVDLWTKSEAAGVDEYDRPGWNDYKQVCEE